jgi:hypothetical protein
MQHSNIFHIHKQTQELDKMREKMKRDQMKGKKKISGLVWFRIDFL